MILSFKTEINGKLTKFRDKILNHLGDLAIDPFLARMSDPGIRQLVHVSIVTATPKKLTIRDDPHNRWSAGRKIHFATGARTKNYMCFAMGECKKVDGIVIVRTTDDKDVLVKIGKKGILTNEEMNQLAIDDGFESVDEFLAFHLGEKRMVVKTIIYF